MTMSTTRHAIITLPNVHLRQESKQIKAISPAVRALAHDMEAATLDWEDHRPHEIGVALAAVQIDKLERVVVIRNDFDNKDDRSFFILINPEVIKTGGDIVYDYEGCLSVKDIYGHVPRHNKVRIKAMDLEGKEIRMSAEGFLARVLQHEIDHTHGVLFIDHIKGQDAFFELNNDGKLEKLDYDKDIANNHILWK